MPQPYCGNRFGSVELSVRAEILCRAMSILNGVMVLCHLQCLRKEMMLLENLVWE